MSAGVATIEHDIDGGRAELEVALPLVVSAQKDLFEPRIPNMKSIMSARTKPLNVQAPIDLTSTSEYISYKLPAAKQGVRLIDADNAEELITILKEAKIL